MCAIEPRRSAPCEGNDTSSGCGCRHGRRRASRPLRAEVQNGVLVRCARSMPTRPSTGSACPGPTGEPEPNLPLRADLVDEIGCIARWLDAEADRVRVVHCDTGLASALPASLRSWPGRQTETTASTALDSLVSVGPVLLLWVFAAACVATTVWFVHRIRVSNRVGVRGRGTAPMRWLFDPCWAARLPPAAAPVASVRPWMRRSRRHDDPPPIALLARDVELHAVALDRDLVMAARAPKSHRRLMLVDLTEQVISLESLAARVVTLGSAQQQLTEPTREAIARMNAQLDALEEAHDEIALLEAQLGLDNHQSLPPTGTDLP
jgi:hypothetical protein